MTKRDLLERQLIACFILDCGKQIELMDGLAEDIRVPIVRDVYQAIKDIVSAGGKADMPTIFAKTGRASELSAIVDTVVTSANRDFYCRALCDEISRDKISELRRNLAASLDQGGDIGTLSHATQIEIDAIEARYHGGAAERSFAEEMADVLTAMRERRPAGDVFRFNFGPVDSLTYGLTPGEYVVLGARPSCGKTAFVVQLLILAAFAGSNTTFFSLEMSKRALAGRVIAHISQTDTRYAMREPERMSADQHSRICSISDVAYGAAQMIQVHSPLNRPWGWIAEQARRDVRAGAKIIALDYLQLLEGDGNNRNEQIGDISRRWKALLSELKVPGIMLAQLSRDCEKENRAPRKSDLRESGNIEQDADIIWFLAPENYQPGCENVSLVQAKGRDVGVGVRKMRFIKEQQRFEEVEQ